MDTGTAIALLGPLALLSVLAHWKQSLEHWTQSGILFMLCAASGIVTGLTWRGEMDGAAGLTTAIVLFGYGIYCFGVAIYSIVRDKNE